MACLCFLLYSVLGSLRKESIEILAYATIEALNRALGGKLKRNGGSEENTVVTRCCFRTHNGYCKALKT
jgi:hypothetical protein